MVDNNSKLTSAEISQLWSNYMNDTMSVCMLSYFKKTAEDSVVRELIEFALELSQKHIQELTVIFQDHNYPIPYGFTEEDVDLSGPQLFTDNYYLYYLHQWSGVGLDSYSLSLMLAANKDVIQYFSECVNESKELLNRTKEVLLSKGLFIRAPYIPIPSKVEFVHKHNFMAGWFGERRPLNTLEIATLFANYQRNALAKVTFIGFSQVAKDKEVIKCMLRGKDLASNHIKGFDTILHASDLPSSETWDTMVTDSTVPVFSDKLMMFHISTLLNRGVGFYGTSLGVSSRRDLGAHYLKILGGLLLFAEDIANLMIDKGWMEQPPSMVNRDELSKIKGDHVKD